MFFYTSDLDRELVARNTALNGKIKSEIGRAYCSLNIPKVFCYGTRSLPSGVVDFLKENNLSCRVFQDTAHLIMTERPDEFYSFLEEFISGTDRQRRKKFKPSARRGVVD